MNRDPRRPPLFLMAMTVLAVASLALGVFSTVRTSTLQEQRNDDRVEYDLESCQRGNVSREANLSIAHANEQMWEGVIVSFATRPDARLIADALLADLKRANKKLPDPIDCQALVGPKS